jgi:hypothetical protein
MTRLAWAVAGFVVGSAVAYVLLDNHDLKDRLSWFRVGFSEGLAVVATSPEPKCSHIDGCSADCELYVSPS